MPQTPLSPTRPQVGSDVAAGSVLPGPGVARSAASPFSPPGGDPDRPADGRARRHHRERRPAAHPGGPWLLVERPVVGDQRVHPDLRRVPPPRRPGRRPLRPPPGLPPRHRRLHAQLAGRRTRRERLDAAGGPRHPGSRRRTGRAVCARRSSPPPSPRAASASAPSASTRRSRPPAERPAWCWAGCSRSWSRGAGSCSSTCRSASRSGSSAAPCWWRRSAGTATSTCSARITCTVGVSGVVFGLVEAGSDGWSSPVTLGRPDRRRRRVRRLLALREPGVRADHAAAAPARTRPATRPTRRAASCTPGSTGSSSSWPSSSRTCRATARCAPAWRSCPMPASVFLASQLTSRVLLRRLPDKVVMVFGSSHRDRGPGLGHAGGRTHGLLADRGVPGADRRRHRHGPGRRSPRRRWPTCSRRSRAPRPAS